MWCKICDGLGIVWDGKAWKYVPCPACKGRGK